MPEQPNSPPGGEILLYQAEDGRTRIECRFQNETLLLTQAQMADLLQTSKQNIAKHLKAVFAEAELEADSVVSRWLTTAPDGKRYKVMHYRLEAILSVGYRVRSSRGTAFRQWATSRNTPRRHSRAGGNPVGVPHELACSSRGTAFRQQATTQSTPHRHSRAGGNPVGVPHELVCSPRGTAFRQPATTRSTPHRHSRAGGNPVGAPHELVCSPRGTAFRQQATTRNTPHRHSRAGGNPVGMSHDS